MMLMNRFHAFIAVVFTLACGAAAAAEPYRPPVSAASDEAERACQAIGVPPGFRPELVAAEPLLANPVAFCFDDRGRILVCETFRPEKGVEDNRRHMDWLDDDLAAMSIEDRRATIEKHAGAGITAYTVEHDRLRRLADTDGDGRFETATVFADGFNDVLDGIGAGVLARGGDVFYTCIPHLWRLRDHDDDGIADERTPLHRGYGVRFAFYGHDLHGLCWGPDGRIYFSIGDRGLNVPVEGGRLVLPDRGAVLRCEPDGSHLEVVHEGLRNPQELAFDDLGTLFTGDNNSDADDKARFVHVIDGGESGWRMPYQYLPDRGPWGRERLWDREFVGQAAFVLPPVEHLASGPSGLCHDPGVGLPPAFAGRFFLADFHGTPAGSGVNAIAVRPQAAGFAVTDIAPFATGVTATDCDFGPDGDLYVLDWVEGWQGTGKGRIHRIAMLGRTPEAELSSRRTQELLTSDLATRDHDELVTLLDHHDARVRLFAQFALAAKKEPALERLAGIAAAEGRSLRSRVHAVWALGQIGRSAAAAAPHAAAAVLHLAAAVPVNSVGDQAEILAQASSVLGDMRHAGALPVLTACLRAASPRVRFFAAQSLGRHGDPQSIAALTALVRDDATLHASARPCDRTLRHAAIVALARCAGSRSPGLMPAPSSGPPEDAAARGDLLLPLIDDPSPDVRLAAALALRRLKSPLVARCLADTDPTVVVEAARGIHDEPITAATASLAAVAERFPAAATGGDPAAVTDIDADALWRRVIAANFTLGGAVHAAAVARLASRPGLSAPLRREALDCLREWAAPPVRDRVLGCIRPLAPRDPALAADALRQTLPAVLEHSGGLAAHALLVAAAVGLADLGPLLAATAVETATPPEVRVQLLDALRSRNAPELPATLATLLADADARVRAGASGVLAQADPEAFLELARTTLAGDSVPELKAALDSLAAFDAPVAREAIAGAIDRMIAGTLPPEAHLEAVEAARARPDAALDARLATLQPDPGAAYHPALHGGDAARGEAIFFFKTEVSCRRCHKVGNRGGLVGPELTGLASSRSRESLLESIVNPNAVISPGYGTVTLQLADGTVVTGVLRAESEESIDLVMPDGTRTSVATQDVEDRAVGLSAMPADIRDKLSLRDLRDLVEYLASLKIASQPAGH
ncbi:MAG: PVC-type heme-binding CxxCH protein [Planctomycetaceae bacterium]